MLMVITTIYQNLLYCSFKFFIKFSHLFLKKPLKDGYYYLHFTDDEKETQNLRNLPKVVSQRRYKVEFVYSKSQLLISMLRCFFLYSSCLDLNSFFPFYIRGTSFNDLSSIFQVTPLEILPKMFFILTCNFTTTHYSISFYYQVSKVPLSPLTFRIP